MNDKERTNYFRRKLSEIKDSPTNNPILVNDEEGTVGEKKNTVTNSLFRTVFVFLAFYGTQYIIFDKLANPGNMTLNFFEAGVVFLFLTSILRRRA
jgi:hypothetical protein